MHVSCLFYIECELSWRSQGQTFMLVYVHLCMEEIFVEIYSKIFPGAGHHSKRDAHPY